ncbi:recombinase RecB [Leptolyngbya sp. FACHB-321]|uniref:recombinase RecB n=1 Tax=Leptolyngbya sp. FACHB-321 TaxID=2692807 RepID=UPI00168239D3|nr:recombinase RecB [Leptolyngbya sp. FACHB-321]MBD2033853.1 recombinase RecB [Leptolyngbya sp. FACHB-321]
MQSVALRKTAAGWEFISEAALEQFVWQNLSELFGFTPLRQQYRLKGEICDLLALDREDGLVLLKLKNVEDRYLMPQTTRYYDSLLEEKPFSDKVDYGRPLRLIAIAPSFHRHNWIDQKYSRLDVECLSFSIHQEPNGFSLHLAQLETGHNIKVALPYQALDLASFDDQLPPPPALLVDWLGACDAAAQKALISTRAKLLRFDPRLQETVVAKSVQTRVIQYGRGQKLCAELCFDRKAKQPVLFCGSPCQLVTTKNWWAECVCGYKVGKLPTWVISPKEWAR